MRPEWYPDWSTQTCALVASGESAAAIDLEKIRGKCRVGVINTSYQLAPWAEVLYACDGRWWDHHKEARSFAGVRVTQDAVTAKRYGLHCIALCDERDPDRDTMKLAPGCIGRGSNSGFQMFNLALQFGARRFMLAGYDFCGDHWHGKHPDGLRNARPQSLIKWRDVFEAAVAKVAGIDVVNLSPVSALSAFPKMSVEQALQRWGIA